MEPTPKISRDEYIQQMRQKMEEILGQVADAINEAPAYSSVGATFVRRAPDPTNWVR